MRFFFRDENFVSINVIYIGYFFVFVEVIFLDFLSPKFTFFPLILILSEKKGKYFFILIWVYKE